MNLRRSLVAQLWKRACSTVANPASIFLEKTSLAESMRRADVYEACSTVANPPSIFLENTSLARSMRRADVYEAWKLKWKEAEKLKMFLQLLHLGRKGPTVEEILNKFTSNDERKMRSVPFVVTKTDLYRWAKLLHKDYKHERARDVFEWMESKNMSLTGYKFAFYIELIAKAKGVDAACSRFRKIEPDLLNFAK